MTEKEIRQQIRLKKLIIQDCRESLEELEKELHGSQVTIEGNGGISVNTQGNQINIARGNSTITASHGNDPFKIKVKIFDVNKEIFDLNREIEELEKKLRMKETNIDDK